MHILKRPPGDSYTLRLFTNLLRSIKQPHDSFYLWSVCIDPQHTRFLTAIGPVHFYEDEIFYRNVLMNSIKRDLVILGIKDHLTSQNFNPWTDTKPDLVEYIDNMFNYYPNKKFIVFTSLENLDYYITNPRVKIIPWGGDIINHQKEYLTVTPVLEKNFDSQFTFLSLNRNQRTHRIMLLSLLHNFNIYKHGLISCMFKDKVDNLFQYTEWHSNNRLEFEEGFKIFKQTNLSINDDYNIYTTGPNDNVGNFKNTLSNYYKNTFVEIITETSYTESCYNFTEKTLNSIYGCSFPILLCSKGSVDFLRNMGMDMFDDIIDHNYDTIEDPADRLYRAITANKELLTNNQATKDLWKMHQERFIKNIDFAKTKLYNFYTQRTTDIFHEFINLQN